MSDRNLSARAVRVTVRYTGSEAALLGAAAAHSGDTLSSLVRRGALDMARRELADGAVDLQLGRDLNGGPVDD
jgi:uncharacterized protein (DUF1778 family)